MSIFGKNIRKLRTSNNLSQQDFGLLFGLSRGSIGSYEEGRADPKIESLVKISKHFKLNIHDLLTKELFDVSKTVIQTKEKAPEQPIQDKKVFIEQRIDNLEKRISELEDKIKSTE